MASIHTGDGSRETATLVCGDRLTSAARDVCRDLLTDGEDTLWVTYTRSPDDCLAELPDADPTTSAVISVGGTTRSASESSGDGGPVQVVGDPTDLTGLGIAIDRALAGRRGTTVCFDSITALLQYVSLDRGYEFLNSLVGRLWRADGHGHFHIDPGAHDPETVALVTSLFDARVDAEARAVTRPTLPGTPG